jgi:hypothetical protein
MSHSRRLVYSASSLYRAVSIYKDLLHELNNPKIPSGPISNVIAIPSNLSPFMIVNNGCIPYHLECVSNNNCICGRAFYDKRIPVAINVDWKNPSTAFQISDITQNGLFLSNGRLINLDLYSKSVISDEPVDVEWI